MTRSSHMHRQREVIDLLLTRNLITQEDLQRARDESKKTGLRIDRALEKLGCISAEEIVKIQATALGLPYMDLTDYAIDATLMKQVSVEMVKKYLCIPLFKIGKSITVGMVDPQDVAAIDQIRRATGVDMIEPVMVSEAGIERILESNYSSGESLDALARSITQEQLAAGKGLGEMAEEPPVIRLVNVMIAQAVRDRASDVHIEPEAEGVRIRCRIDGVLREAAMISKDLQNAVISRIKVMSALDIAETRKPQDGRFRLTIENRTLDARVSTFPTIHGENVVMRLLDKTSLLFGLKDIGFSTRDLTAFQRLIERPNGIILVTGPTGSGKTSTLYTALTAISSIEKNIITIEDPVEYELPLIRQTQINHKAGITFATGLRSILRQDPDIIMVGEIRDRETVDVAMQAALTGHLVLATLHTNDAASAMSRLIDMGVEPFLVASSVAGIIAQRLVRLICPKCKESYEPSQDTLRELGLNPDEPHTFFRGKGCGRCHDQGFAGRMGIFEVMPVSEDIRHLVESRKSADDIKQQAIKDGMTPLREDGLTKVLQGVTTPEEVLRVTEVE